MRVSRVSHTSKYATRFFGTSKIWQIFYVDIVIVNTIFAQRCARATRGRPLVVRREVVILEHAIRFTNTFRLTNFSIRTRRLLWQSVHCRTQLSESFANNNFLKIQSFLSPSTDWSQAGSFPNEQGPAQIFHVISHLNCLSVLVSLLSTHGQ